MKCMHLVEIQDFTMIAVTATLSVFILMFCSGWAAECPKPTPYFRSQDKGTNSFFGIKNKAGVPVLVSWLDFRGKESVLLTISIDASHEFDSFIGHSFRIYADTGNKPLLMEHVIKKERDVIAIYACDGVEPFQTETYLSPDHEEMESLVHDQEAPCLPEEKSSEWSCVRWIKKEEYERRVRDGTVYGFNSTRESGHRKVGETMDTGYVSHITNIPRVTNGKGFLKMNFTDKLRNTLIPWYENNRKGGPLDSVEVHPTIPGRYTNIHTVAMSKIDLDKHRNIQYVVEKEMNRILEWWTGRRLQHTSTFGLRIYHRDSMLINHVDRADTHIASAVIQVAQDVDEGWPLEIIDPETGNCAEVYLQPGEFVLYEGARFPHGRPMRFNGTDFANIFSHFRPLDWSGPGKSPVYDGKIDKQGYTSVPIVGGEDRMGGQFMHTEL